MRPGMILYREELGMLLMMTNEEAGEAIRMLARRFLIGKDPEPTNERVEDLLSIAIPKQDADDAEYLQKVESGRAGGQKRAKVLEAHSKHSASTSQAEAKHSPSTLQAEGKHPSSTSQAEANETRNKKQKQETETGNNKEIYSAGSTATPSEMTIVEDAVRYLNARTGSKYSTKAKQTQNHILARIREGRTLDDFKTVIDRKADEWLSDSKMARYLRPETLFGTKFESYLNAPDVHQRGKLSGQDYAEHGYDWDELERLATRR